MDAPVQNRESRSHLVWGTLLILFGLLALANVFFEMQLLLWAGIMGIAGVAFLGGYVAMRREPALLIPSYISFAVAGLLAVIGLNILRDEAIAYYVLSAIALPFIIGWLRDTRNWGLLIPAYVLLSVCGVIFLAENNLVRGEFIATFILSAIALPFLLGFVTDPKERWGMLIPAYVLLAVGVMVGLIGMGVLYDLLIPAYVMYAVAAPFLLVFFLNRHNWWALIPGGIMAVIGTGFLLSERAVQYALPVAFILGGLFLLMGGFRRNKPEVETMPLTGPEADRAPEKEKELG